MCKICEDYLDDGVCKKIGYNPTSLGELQDIWWLETWMFIDPEDDKTEEPRLNVCLNDSNTGYDISSFNINISYRPFCGRKL